MPGDLSSLIVLLQHERWELKTMIHIARCGIRKEWIKAETKWECLHKTHASCQDIIKRLAEELRISYVRIYRALLLKNRKLLDELNRIEDETTLATLLNLKRRVASEIASMDRSIETLGGAGFSPEDDIACECLICRKENSPAHDPDLIPAIADASGPAN